MAKKEKPAEAEQAAETQPQPQLNIADIQGAVAAIDYACAQGAYKGWDVVRSVFETREKLAAFVMSVAVPVAPGEEVENG